MKTTIKMKYQFKIFIGILIVLTGLSNRTLAQDHMILLNEVYKVNSSTSLNIENQFGDIKITTWNKPEFSIKVTLNLSGLSEKEAEKIKDKVNISESISSQQIAIKTKLSNGSFKVKSSGKKFEVNYEIFVPDDHLLKIKNSFGNLAIQDYNGPLDLNVEYGNLFAGALDQLKLKLAFGNGTIESIIKGDLLLEYSDKFSITQVDYIDLRSDFSKVNISEANHIALNGKYGNLSIGNINKITGSSEFSGLKIKELKDILQLKVAYVSGNLEVEKVSGNFKDINIKSEFSAIKLNFESGQQIPFHVTTSFGNFKQPKNNTNLSLKIEDDFDKEYKGTFGQGSKSNGKVIISNSYGNVSLEIN